MDNNGNNNKNQSTISPQNITTKKVIKVSAVDLFNAYDANEVAVGEE